MTMNRVPCQARRSMPEFMQRYGQRGDGVRQCRLFGGTAFAPGALPRSRRFPGLQLPTHAKNHGAALRLMCQFGIRDRSAWPSGLKLAEAMRLRREGRVRWR